MNSAFTAIPTAHKSLHLWQQMIKQEGGSFGWEHFWSKWKGEEYTMHVSKYYHLFSSPGPLYVILGSWSQDRETLLLTDQLSVLAGRVQLLERATAFET